MKRLINLISKQYNTSYDFNDWWFQQEDTVHGEVNPWYFNIDDEQFEQVVSIMNYKKLKKIRWFIL